MKLTGNRLLARRVRQKVEAICNDRRGLHWEPLPADVRRDLYRHVEREVLLVLDGRAARHRYPYESSELGKDGST